MNPLVISVKLCPLCVSVVKKQSVRKHQNDAIPLSYASPHAGIRTPA